MQTNLRLDFVMAIRVSFFVTAIPLLFTCIHVAGQGSMIPKFSYTGNNGPREWGHLSPDFEMCSTGKSQSPINILTKKAIVDKNMKPLRRMYSISNATLVNHGFNVMMEFGNAGIWLLDGKNYTLQQMHWHTPSEHMLDGAKQDAELHLVHRSIDGSIAVIGILFEIGRADPILAKVQKYLATLAYEEQKKQVLGEIPLGVFKAWRLRRNTRKYYRYVGSLTTPPCSENVLWHVFGKVRSISKEQIEALRAPLTYSCKTNSRPVQPLNGRKVYVYEGLAN